TRTNAARFHVTRRWGGAACAATRRTRSRSSSGAVGRASRSWAIRSRCDIERHLELLQRAVETRRAVGGGDAEHARGGPGVEVEDDAERDHLALAGGQAEQRGLELGREPFGNALLEDLGHRYELLALHAPPLGAEVVERDRARDLAEPGADRPAPLVEAVPEPQRALERLAGEILGGEAVAGEPGEVPVDVVQVRLGRLREARHAVYTPPGPAHVTLSFSVMSPVRSDDMAQGDNPLRPRGRPACGISGHTVLFGHVTSPE